MAKIYYDKKRNIICYHPGYYIQDIAEEKDERDILITGLGKETLMGLINGDIDITREIAKKLELCTGINSLTWISIQKSYDEAAGRKNEIEDDIVNEYISTFKKLPLLFTLLTLSMFPLLFVPFIIVLLFSPFIFNLDVAITIFYYINLIFILPVIIMLGVRLKKIFKKTIKFICEKIERKDY